MWTAQRRRGVPSPTGWSVSLSASPLSWPTLADVLSCQAMVPIPAAACSRSSEPLAIPNTPCLAHLAPSQMSSTGKPVPDLPLEPTSSGT